jgi:hypothetical protein
MNVCRHVGLRWCCTRAQHCGESEKKMPIHVC